MDEPRFLTLDEVLYLHDETLRRFGGSDGIGNLGLFESAMGSAQNACRSGSGELFEISAAYAFHMAESQAFVDGNKRTGAAAEIMLLRQNGVRFPKEGGPVYAALINVANKKLNKAGLAAVLRRLVETNG